MDMKEIRNEKTGSLEPTGSKLTTKLGRWTIVAPAICLFSLVAGLSAICNEVWLLFAGLLYLSAMTSLFYFVQGKLKIPWIFDELDSGAGSLAVLFWWEKRRPAYNVLMFVLLVGSYFVYVAFMGFSRYAPAPLIPWVSWLRLFLVRLSGMFVIVWVSLSI